MKTTIFSLVTLAFFFGNSPKVTFHEEVNMTLSLGHAYQKSTEYIASLPKVDKLLNNKIIGSEQERFIESSKSFIAYRQHSFYKQPKAEVHYRVRLDFTEGKYAYQFSDFHIYTYKRNRYGIFDRSSSKKIAIEKLSVAKQKELKPLIAMEISKYVAGLKSSLSF